MYCDCILQDNATGGIDLFVQEPDKVISVEGWAYLTPLDVFPR